VVTRRKLVAVKVFDAKAWESLMVGSIVPKLGFALAQLVINPMAQVNLSEMFIGLGVLGLGFGNESRFVRP
jgi:hypothetical protein